jgi:hypothetical protein
VSYELAELLGAFFPAHRLGHVPHHVGIGAHASVRVEILCSPRAQQEPRCL